MQSLLVAIGHQRLMELSSGDLTGELSHDSTTSGSSASRGQSDSV